MSPEAVDLFFVDSFLDAHEAAPESITLDLDIVGQIRERWPDIAILLRGDSGFARESLMSGC